MSNTPYSDHVSGFLNDILAAHRAFAAIAVNCYSDNSPFPINPIDIGTVLGALNTLSEINLEAFAAQLESEFGPLRVLRSRLDPTFLQVTQTSSAKGHAGEARADSQQELRAPLMECHSDDIRTGTISTHFPTVGELFKNNATASV